MSVIPREKISETSVNLNSEDSKCSFRNLTDVPTIIEYLQEEKRNFGLKSISGRKISRIEYLTSLFFSTVSIT